MNGLVNIMTIIAMTILPFMITSTMTYPEALSSIRYRVHGRVIDEHGHTIPGADILVASSVERRSSFTSDDGRFIVDICVSGPLDAIYVEAFHDFRSGSRTIMADDNTEPVDIILYAESPGHGSMQG